MTRRQRNALLAIVAIFCGSYACAKPSGTSAVKTGDWDPFVATDGFHEFRVRQQTHLLGDGPWLTTREHLPRSA